jgi:ribosomal RNA-processing protein 12
LLQENLKDSQNNEKTELPTLAQMALDLIIIMIPYLSAESFNPLWNLVIPLLKLKDDPNMQRRAYRCLAKIAEIDVGKEFLLSQLDQVVGILKSPNAHTTSQKVMHFTYPLI